MVTCLYFGILDEVDDLVSRVKPETIYRVSTGVASQALPLYSNLRKTAQEGQ